MMHADSPEVGVTEARFGFRASGFFALRVPYLSRSEGVLAPLAFNAVRAIEDGGDLQTAWAQDAQMAMARVTELVKRSDVREALFVASPDLTRALESWDPTRRDEASLRTQRSLVKYLSRMSTRCTPFGLFAGCSVGTVGQQTDLTLQPRTQYRRQTRLDMDYLSLLLETVVSTVAMRQELRYVPNPSLHVAGDRLHAVVGSMHGRTRHFDLVAFDHSEYLAQALDEAKSGALLQDIARCLTTEEVEESAAAEFALELVDAGLLVPDIGIAVTGSEPTQSLALQLQQFPAAAAPGQSLLAAHDLLAAIDSAGIGRPQTDYLAVARVLNDNPVPADIARLFQVDMYSPAASASVAPQIVEDISRSAYWLSRLRAYESDSLRGFREAFRSRYEGQRVPLLEVLDDEIGVGFTPSYAGTRDQATGRRTALLLERLLAAQARGEREIVLDEQTLERLSVRATPDLPSAFSVTATISATSEEGLNGGEYSLLMEGVQGPSGARMLGRFCHGDPQLGSMVASHLAEEESLFPGRIVAEIVHMPFGRIGNVLCRPTMRRYEIPFFGVSSVPTDCQIELSDLEVEVTLDRVRLHSRRLGVEIVPRLTTAHNFGLPNNLVQYQFLCALQQQDGSGASWDWGELREAKALPRVRIGRVTVARAAWLLDAGDLKSLDGATPEDAFRAAHALRQRLSLPRTVALCDSDNELVVDLENPVSVDAFIALTRKRTSALLKEVLNPDDGLIVTGEAGKYCHEIVMPFVRTTPAAQPRVAALPRLGTSDRPRQWAPGSEWLYAKLYVGPGMTNRVLRSVVAPLIRRLGQDGVIDKWFFIRYADPQHHIRLRLHGSASALSAVAVPLLHEATAEALRSRVISKVQLDTYDAEVERYGGPSAMEVAEDFFHLDSEAVLDCLAGSAEESNAAVWQRLCLRGVHDLLTVAYPDVSARLSAVSRPGRLTTGQGKHLRNEAFRRDRQMVTRALQDTDGSVPDSDAEAHVLQRRAAAFQGLWIRLTTMQEDGLLEAPLEDILFSFTHMYCNRLLKNGNAAEQSAYEYLARYYTAARGREHSRAIRGHEG